MFGILLYDITTNINKINHMVPNGTALIIFYSVGDYRGTFLDNSRLSLWKLLLFTNHFLHRSWDHKTVIESLHISPSTSVDWRSFCSEVTEFWLGNQKRNREARAGIRD